MAWCSHQRITHLLPANLLPSVEEFKLSTDGYHIADVDLHSFITALQAVPSAISVRIHICSVIHRHEKIGVTLLERLASENEDEVLCPKLRDLEFIYPRWHQPRQAKLGNDEVDLIQRITKVRKQMGRELGSFVVRTTHSSGTMFTHHCL